MSKFTKQAIMDGFIELSKQMPIDKITVKKVTDYIGITRNTFYYHYQDIYALLEEIVVTKAKKLFVLDEDNLENSWKSNLRFMGQYGKKNENFIRNLYQSMGRDSFGDQLLEISYGSIYRSVQAYAEKEMVQIRTSHTRNRQSRIHLIYSRRCFRKMQLNGYAGVWNRIRSR